MALVSKFQHRLIGTIIIVALGVIILPNILDGKKKYYKEEALAIPLALQPKDRQEINLVPPVTQTPEYIDNSDNSSQAKSGSILLQLHNQPRVIMPFPVQQKKKSKPIATIKQKTKSFAKSVKETQGKENNSKDETTPTGQIYVVQLGALKNAAKVNEIVAKLRLSGYRVFTAPAKPLQGQLTRIYVGPDAPDAPDASNKMALSVSQLQSLSGLEGIVRSYDNTR